MFEIVNPIIIGTLQTKYNETNPIDAAKLFWNDFSKKIVNDIPKSFFTLRNENGRLYHFKVTEKKNGKNVDFMISPVENIDKTSNNLISTTFDKFTELGHKYLDQNGGKKHDSDDDSSSSSSDSSSDSVDEIIEKFKKINRTKLRPISYYYYVPSIYTSDNLYLPVFNPTVIPHYVEIGFSTAFWK